MQNKILRIGLIGADGRMGKAIAELATSDILFTPFTHSHKADSSSEVDLFLDVSTPLALSSHLEAALLAKKPIVIGTTGHLTLDLFLEAARSIPLFYSANFSLGMALMKKTMKEWAQKFDRQATIQIVESHHEHKKDTPSGSALMLAGLAEAHHPSKPEIRSIRFGEIVGKHEVFFDGREETFTLVHEVKSRRAFAEGALLAARFLALQSPGFYTMDDLIDHFPHSGEK